MVKNTNVPRPPKLYLMEREYDRRGNDIWHEVELVDLSNVKAIGQRERILLERPLATKWNPLEVAIERSKKTADLCLMGGFTNDFAASARGSRAATVARPQRRVPALEDSCRL